MLFRLFGISIRIFGLGSIERIQLRETSDLHFRRFIHLFFFHVGRSLVKCDLLWYLAKFSVRRLQFSHFLHLWFFIFLFFSTTIRVRAFSDKEQLSLYSLYAWGISFLLTVFGLIMDNISIPEYLQPGFGQETCFVKGNSLLEHTYEIVAIDYIFQFYVCRIISEIETYLLLYTLMHHLHCKCYIFCYNRV